jgi:tight adherence protein B
MRIERKVKSMTAQGRMQGIIVSAMPVFLGIVMTVMKPKMMLPFLCSLTGAISVLTMIVLITIGWLIIRKIIKIDV